MYFPEITFIAGNSCINFVYLPLLQQCRHSATAALPLMLFCPPDSEKNIQRPAPQVSLLSPSTGNKGENTTHHNISASECNKARLAATASQERHLGEATAPESQIEWEF